MADRITAQDLDEVIARVREGTISGEPSYEEVGRGEILSADGFRVVVSGWIRGGEFSRGFSVAGEMRTVGRDGEFDLLGGCYVHVLGFERFEGRGWHRRMAEEILVHLRRFRDDSRSEVLSSKEADDG